MFIVQIVGPNGVVSWVTVSASNSSEARNKVQQGSEQGFTANQVFPASSSGVQQATQAGFTGTLEDIPSFDSPAPPNFDDAVPVITPPADDDTVQGPGQVPIGSDTSEFRFSQFLRGLQDRGAGGSGIAGQARERQFRPVQARFLANQALNPLGNTPQTFAQFTQSQPLAGENANAAAGNLFTQALNLGRGVSPTGGGFDQLTELQQQLLNPADSFQAQRLGDLALGAARGRLGASAEFLPGSADLFARFAAQPQTGALSFGDFLNQRIFGQ